MNRKLVSVTLSASIIAGLFSGCGINSQKAAKAAANNVDTVKVSVEMDTNNGDALDNSAKESLGEEEKKVEKLSIEVSDWAYDNIIYFSEDYLIAKENDKYFIVDKEGNEISSDSFSDDIDTMWDSVSYWLQDGCMIGVAGDEESGYKSYLIDRNLNVLYADEDESGYLKDYRDDLIRKEYKGEAKLTFIPLGEDPINISGIKENQMISNSSYGTMIVSGSVYYSDIDAFAYTFKTSELIKNRSIIPEMIKPCKVGDYYVMVFDNSPDKDGFVSAGLFEKNTETGNFDPYMNGFYNINTGDFYKGDNDSTSNSYRIEKNGSTKCTVIDGRSLLCVDQDDNGNIYRIYDVKNEEYASEERYYSAAISYYDYLLVQNMDKQYGFIRNDDLTQAGEWYDDASAFANGYALVNKDGMEYLVNEDFEIVSDGFEAQSAYAPTSYLDFSDIGDNIVFFAKTLDDKYHLVQAKMGE